MDLRGHYLNRSDQEEHEESAIFDVDFDVLGPLRELVLTL